MIILTQDGWVVTWLELRQVKISQNLCIYRFSYNVWMLDSQSTHYAELVVQSLIPTI